MALGADAQPIRVQVWLLHRKRPIRQPLPVIEVGPLEVIVPEKVLPMSGTNTRPLHWPGPTCLNSRNSWVPTSFAVPASLALACALGVAQTTTPQTVSPQGCMRT